MVRSLVAASAAGLIYTSSLQAAATALDYQIEGPDDAASAKPDSAVVITAVKRRLDTLGVVSAEVTARDKEQLSIDVSAVDEKTIERITKSLSQPGHIEFRIVADPRYAEDEEPIELGKKTADHKEVSVVRNKDGVVLAEWVRMPDRGVTLSSDNAALGKTEDGKLEVLILRDDYNVTGRYITKAKALDDAPGVAFELDAKGGKRFGELTGDNLPRPSGLARRLGIVIDRQLRSAATIQSRITRQGEITGHFTEAEVAEMVTLLRSGELPAKLKLVADPTAKKQ